QVLVSQSTRELLEDEEESGGIVLRDLGEQRLKDLDRPVRLHQLVLAGQIHEFPPLRTLSPAPADGPPLKARRGRSRPWGLVAPAALVVAGVVAAVLLLTRGGGSARASAVAADSVGVFNARTRKLLTQAPVRAGPDAV